MLVLKETWSTLNPIDGLAISLDQYKKNGGNNKSISLLFNFNQVFVAINKRNRHNGENICNSQLFRGKHCVFRSFIPPPTPPPIFMIHILPDDDRRGEIDIFRIENSKKLVFKAFYPVVDVISPFFFSP